MHQRSSGRKIRINGFTGERLSTKAVKQVRQVWTLKKWRWQHYLNIPGGRHLSSNDRSFSRFPRCWVLGSEPQCGVMTSAGSRGAKRFLWVSVFSSFKQPEATAFIKEDTKRISVIIVFRLLTSNFNILQNFLLLFQSTSCSDVVVLI